MTFQLKMMTVPSAWRQRLQILFVVLAAVAAAGQAVTARGSKLEERERDLMSRDRKGREYIQMEGPIMPCQRSSRYNCTVNRE